MEEKENQAQSENISTELKPEVKPQTELKPDDWLCIVCRKRITNDKSRFIFENQSEFQFTNPNGYVFDILTFSEADGCREIGERTMEFTWFPGYSWSFAACSRCRTHLGWKYSGNESFYGLIKTRLVKGSTLFN